MATAKVETERKHFTFRYRSADDFFETFKDVLRADLEGVGCARRGGPAVVPRPAGRAGRRRQPQRRRCPDASTRSTSRSSPPAADQAAARTGASRLRRSSSLGERAVGRHVVHEHLDRAVGRTVALRRRCGSRVASSPTTSPAPMSTWSSARWTSASPSRRRNACGAALALRAQDDAGIEVEQRARRPTADERRLEGSRGPRGDGRLGRSGEGACGQGAIATTEREGIAHICFRWPPSAQALRLPPAGQLVDQPPARAVGASMGSPVRARSAVRWRPMRRGRLTVPPAPGIRPRDTSGRPKVASALATTRPANAGSSTPDPRQAPCTCAVTRSATASMARPRSGGSARGARSRGRAASRTRRGRRRRRTPGPRLAGAPP